MKCETPTTATPAGESAIGLLFADGVMKVERGEDSARSLGGFALAAKTAEGGGDKASSAAAAGSGTSASGIETFLNRAPVPEEMFDRSAILQIVAPSRVIGASAVAVYLAVGCVFAFCCAFYAAPANWVATRFVSINWREEGHLCRTINGQSGMKYTFDECLANVRPLTTSLIDFTSLSTDGVVAFTSLEKQIERGILFTFSPEYRSLVWEADFGNTDIVRPIDDTLASFPYLPSDEYSIEETEGGSFVGKCSGACAANPNATLWKDIFSVLIENLGRTNNDDVQSEAEILCAWTKYLQPYICSKSQRMSTLDITAIAGNFASLTSAALITAFALGLRRIYPVSRDDVGNGKQKHFISKFLLPAELYDERHELPFIAGKRTTLAYTISTILLKCVAFAVLLWYYRQSGQYESDKRVSVRHLDGYQCTPFMSRYGVNVTRSQCLSSLRRPSATSVQFMFSEMSGIGLPDYAAIDGMRPGFHFTSRAVAGVSKPAWYGAGSSTVFVSMRSWNTYSLSTEVPEREMVTMFNVGPWDETSRAQVLEVLNTFFDESGGEEKICDRYFQDSAPYECINEQATHSFYFAASLAYGVYEILSIIWSFLGVLVLSLWPSKHRDAGIQPERFWKSRLPLPQQFYRQNVMNFITSPIRVLSAHFFILAGVIAVFSISLPVLDDAMKRSEVQVISEPSDYAKYKSEGYRCRVAYADVGESAAPYALWDERECKERVRPPSISGSGFGYLRVANNATEGSGWFQNPGIVPGMYTSKGDVRFHPYGDAVSSFGTAEMSIRVTGGPSRPSPIFDSFRAFMDDLKTEFNTDSIRLVGPEQMNGIYVQYLNEPDQQRDKVMDAFTRIYDALGAERLCWFITQADNFVCEKERKEARFAVWSLAWANAALVWLLLLKVIPMLIRDGSHIDRVASNRELDAAC